MDFLIRPDLATWAWKAEPGGCVWICEENALMVDSGVSPCGSTGFWSWFRPSLPSGCCDSR